MAGGGGVYLRWILLIDCRDETIQAQSWCQYPKQDHEVDRQTYLVMGPNDSAVASCDRCGVGSAALIMGHACKDRLSGGLSCCPEALCLQREDHER